MIVFHVHSADITISVESVIVRVYIYI